MECNWDGGDCCGDNVNTEFCSNCDCLNSNVKICTTEKPCGLDEGDCNYDNECQPGLKCGENNCPVHLFNHSSIDCCYKQDECNVFETLVENAECPFQLILTLFNEAAKYIEIYIGYREVTYILNDDKVNGKSYWSGPDGNAIWNFNGIWFIGSSADIGSSEASLVLDFGSQCPHQGNGNWKFFKDGNWLDAGNDVQLKMMDTGLLSKSYFQI